MDDFSTKLQTAMENNNIHIDGNINWYDREFQRFRSKDHYKRGKPLFVCLHGDGATFGDWRDPSTWRTVWAKSWRDITREEKLLRTQELLKLKAEKQARTSDAIYRCNLLLNHATWRGKTCLEASLDQQYIKTKRIIPYYGLQIRSYLVLKICDINGKLQSLQFISPTRFKRFKKYASPKDGMLFLTEPLSKNYAEIIRICEGYATGCSIYEAMGFPVICALGASNLLSVALSLRTKYPLANIQICADNDQWNKENVGINLAMQTAALTGASLHYPTFENLNVSTKPTDFNDLMCLAGIEEVERQLLISRRNPWKKTS